MDKKRTSTIFKRLGELIEKGYSLPQGIEFLLIYESDKHQKDLKACLDNLKMANYFMKR